MTDPGEPLAVDHLSWARREQGRISVSLVVTGVPDGPGPTEMELSDGNGNSLVAPAEVTPYGQSVAIRFDVPRESLGDSAWQVSLRTSAGTSIPVSARLLAAPHLPVALLPGPAPVTRLRAPAPRRRHSSAHALARRVVRRLPAPARSAVRAARDRSSRAGRRS